MTANVLGPFRIAAGGFLFSVGLLALTLLGTGRPGIGVFDSTWMAAAAVAVGSWILPSPRRQLCAGCLLLVGAAGVAGPVLRWEPPRGGDEVAALLLCALYTVVGWWMIAPRPVFSGEVAVTFDAPLWARLTRTSFSVGRVAIESDGVRFFRRTGQDNAGFFEERREVLIRYADVIRLRRRFGDITLTRSFPSGRVEVVVIESYFVRRGDWIGTQQLYLGLRERFAAWQSERRSDGDARG